MTKAIILSGGEGTRLRPLTLDTPKPMLPIAGVPHLEYIIRLLKKHDITDIIFSTGYLHSQIVDYFGDGSQFDVSIKYREDGDTPLGTAGAIKNCEDLLDEEPFLVFNGDILTNLNLDNLILNHKHEGITMSLARVRNPMQFGLVMIDIEKKVLAFVEKPSVDFLTNYFSLTSAHSLVNAGIYVISRSALDDFPTNEHCMIETDIFPEYVMASKLYSYTEEMYWLDIGTFERLNLAHKDVAHGFFKC